MIDPSSDFTDPTRCEFQAINARPSRNPPPRANIPGSIPALAPVMQLTALEQLMPSTPLPTLSNSSVLTVKEDHRDL